MAVSTILFEDIFDVKDIDQDGKKFERGQWYNGTWCMQTRTDLNRDLGCTWYLIHCQNYTACMHAPKPIKKNEVVT